MGNSDRIFRQSNDVQLLGKLGNKLLFRPSEMKCGKIKKALLICTMVSGYKPWARSAWQRDKTGSGTLNGAFASEVYLA